MTNIPLFGTSASLISPPAGTVTSGYFPLQYFPAEHLNYLFNGSTQAIQELVNVIQTAGLTPSSTDTQLRSSLAALYGRQPPVGLPLTYVSTTSFSVGPGVAGDSTFADMMLFASTYTKTTATWVAGNAVGGLDTGAIAATTWYYVYLIKNPTSGLVDWLYSASATTPTMPTGYTLKRLIGAVKTDGSSHFLKWIMYADGTQEWADNNHTIATTITTSRSTQSLVLSPPIVCKTAIYIACVNTTPGSAIQIMGDNQITDTAPGLGSSDMVIQVSGVYVGCQKTLITDAGNIYSRATAINTSLDVGVISFNVRPFN